MMRLAKSARCPIHNSLFCCGRVQRETRIADSRANRPTRKSPGSKWIQTAPGVWRIDDPHHPRGYRERRSKSAMRKLLMRKFKEQGGRCALCGEEFYEAAEITPDHILPRGMNASTRDDHPDNIQAAHGSCNHDKGSKRP